PVGDRAGRREAKGPGLDALAHDGGHGFDVGVGGGLVLGAALAHYERPYGAVGHLGTHVDHAALRVDGVEVLGEALPAPLDSLGEGGAGNVLDPLHKADEP